MNWLGIILALTLGAALGAVGQQRIDDRQVSAARSESVCLALVKAGVVVSCTYEGEK